MLVRGPEVLQAARASGRAVAAFTTYTLESTRALWIAADNTALPLIIQAGAGSFKGVGRDLLAAACLKAATSSTSSVGVHLDHGRQVSEVDACIALGYTSIMFDTSNLPFVESVEAMRDVVAMCHARRVWVEGEIGVIGGEEERSTAGPKVPTTEPEEAEEFVIRTGVDALAVAIGNVHGRGSGVVHLDLALLARIAALVSVPLVLHGASGVPVDELLAAVKLGVAKVNFNTDFRRQYLALMRAGIDPESDDLGELQASVVEKLAFAAEHWLQLLARPEVCVGRT